MEKKPSAIDVRIRRQQEKLLEALAESGNVSFACKKAESVEIPTTVGEKKMTISLIR
jgi:hypothetical protein